MEYIMKSTKLRSTPASLIHFDKILDDADFIQDPDQFRDDLPQPYRMVNKIIDDILSSTWEIIYANEAKELADSAKIQPPKYDCASICDLQGKSPTSVVSSVDGCYVFVGTTDSLLAVDSEMAVIISQYDEVGMLPVFLKCSTIIQKTHIICVLDDLGIARIFAFLDERFFLIKTFIDHQDSVSKAVTTHCETSTHAGFLILSQENSVSGETFLEVHKLPGEVWMKEFETLSSSLENKRSQLLSELGDNTSVSLPLDGEDTQSEKVSVTSSQPTIEKNHPELVAIERSFKATIPLIHMKIKTPPKQSDGHSFSVYQGCKQSDMGELIGHGITHMISQIHLDVRRTVFNVLHPDIPVRQTPHYLPECIQPTFHFLTQGNVTVTADPTARKGQATSLVVWWSGQRFIYHYSLVKPPPKDLEQKPDLVIPFFHSITCTCVSQCSTLLAVGLDNGNVVLWDLFSGIQRGVVNTGGDVSVTSLHFTNPGLCTDQIDADTVTQVLVLAVCDKSRVYLLSFGPVAGRLHVLQICDSLDDYNGQRITMISPLPTLSNIIVRVERNGVIYLQDITNQALICQLCLPSTHDLATPWQPGIAAAARGGMLFMRGLMKRKDETESTEGEEECCHLLLYQLRFLPSLDTYWKNPPPVLPFSCHPCLEERVNNFMKRRAFEQADRKVRMQRRWGQFKDELLQRVVASDLSSLKKTATQQTTQDLL